MRVLLSFCMFACLGCGGIRGYHWAGGTGDVTHAIEPGARVVFPNTQASSRGVEAVKPTCDGTLAVHVYHPQRLKVIQQCVTVNGVLVDATHGRRKDGQRHEADGDNHGWLKPDQAFEWTVIAGNKTAEGGNLVLECVCQYPVTQKDAKSACRGFRSKVKIPAVGSHIAVTGVLVEDLDHQPIHRELHPVSVIEVLR
jgi:hypothetical protein